MLFFLFTSVCPLEHLGLHEQCGHSYIALFDNGRWYMVVYVKGVFSQQFSWLWCDPEACKLRQIKAISKKVT